MKYITVKIGEQRLPILFPKQLCHDAMAKAVLKMLEECDVLSEVSSAGEAFVSVQNTGGRSTTLNLGPAPTDELLINTIDYSHGFLPEDPVKTRPAYRLEEIEESEE